MQPVEQAHGWRNIERYAYVKRPYEDVWAWLGGHLSTIGEPLPGGGRSVTLRIHPGGREISRPVRLRVHGLVCHQDRARAALGWADASRPRWFPQFEGVLEVVPVPNDGVPFTQLGVVARYRPPLGPLGIVGDRLVGAEITDAALTTFLDELAEAVEVAIPRPGHEPPVAELDLPELEATETKRLLLALDGLAVRPDGAVGVYRTLRALPGVTSVSIDPRAGMVTVDYAGPCGSDQMMAALSQS